jgi:hypothetical protein
MGESFIKCNFYQLKLSTWIKICTCNDKIQYIYTKYIIIWTFEMKSWNVFSTLHGDSNLFFNIILFAKCFIKIWYVIHFFKNMNFKNNNDKNINQQIVMNFWMIRFGLYFQKLKIFWNLNIESELTILHLEQFVESYGPMRKQRTKRTIWFPTVQI